MTIKTVFSTPGSVPIKVWTDDIEQSAIDQAKNLATMPFIHKNGVSLMPDVHMGIGSTVGSVIATDKAIIPAAIGVDIGCGMNALRLSLKASDLPDDLRQIRLQIERDVPTGPGGAHKDGENTLAFTGLQMPRTLANNWDYVVGTNATDTAIRQLGSLGAGNHFIELCLDEESNVWIMLHSGSRGIGNKIGRFYIEQAKRNMETYFINLPDKDLAYLPEDTKDFNDYMDAVGWAQAYAFKNREIMMDTVLKALRRHIGIDFEITREAINCHHNYVERENHFGTNLWITRKGAIRARKGDLGIIPGSMGARSFIVQGLGEAQSYHSCSHGAGRKMGRKEAARQFTVADLVSQTQGVECRKDKDVIDEIPGAYKDISDVMSNQSDLVKILHTLKQVLCVKGN